MYEGVKNTMKRNMYLRLLSTIVAATVSGPTACAYLPEAKAKELDAAQSGLILINPNVKNEKGEIGVRATDAAVQQVQASPAPAAKSEAPKMDFKIESGIEPPVVSRGPRAGAETYPFSKLEAGQSFFIPATDSRPDPAKSLLSTVSAASRRYATRVKDEATGKDKITGYERKFLIRAVDGGARVWRTK
jgi:hypothetical protein